MNKHCDSYLLCRAQVAVIISSKLAVDGSRSWSIHFCMGYLFLLSTAKSSTPKTVLKQVHASPESMNLPKRSSASQIQAFGQEFVLVKLPQILTIRS